MKTTDYSLGCPAYETAVHNANELAGSGLQAGRTP